MVAVPRFSDGCDPMMAMTIAMMAMTITIVKAMMMAMTMTTMKAMTMATVMIMTMTMAMMMMALMAVRPSNDGCGRRLTKKVVHWRSAHHHLHLFSSSCCR